LIRDHPRQEQLFLPALIHDYAVSTCVEGQLLHDPPKKRAGLSASPLQTTLS
jgi:hypothetical protein